MLARGMSSNGEWRPVLFNSRLSNNASARSRADLDVVKALPFVLHTIGEYAKVLQERVYLLIRPSTYASTRKTVQH
jgi:hypothetical protein